MKQILMQIICAGIAVAGTSAAYARHAGGKISASTFDGRGNKEVLAEAVHVQREVAPAPAPAPAPQSVTMTQTDSKGKVMRTVERTGDSTTVKDGKGRVISTTTKNPDGSTTTRDGHGAVRVTTGTPAKK